MLTLGAAGGSDAIVGWLLRPQTAAALLGVSLALLGVSALVVPAILRRIPANYFVVEPPRAPRSGVALLARVARNLLGAGLLGLGVAMLVLPGQGVLTILASLVLLDFPGRRAVLRRIVAVPRLRRAIDAWRRAGGVPPLDLGPDAGTPP